MQDALDLRDKPGHCAIPIRTLGLRDASNTMGRSAEPCKSARPHRQRDVGRCTPSNLESVVELLLGEKRAGRLEAVIGPAQFLDQALQKFNALTLVAAEATRLPVSVSCRVTQSLIV